MLFFTGLLVQAKPLAPKPETNEEALSQCQLDRLVIQIMTYEKLLNENQNRTQENFERILYLENILQQTVFSLSL